MEIGSVLHGFTVENKRYSEELKGTLYEMKHGKTGAELIFLDNKADNKLFSAAFKTLPWDDTGVFHILEHSVLAGSEHYPVKEPFLDLLKSSMNTFLNAMTFPDKTMYPVSSRNEQDFLNLTRVYLDAVFKPAIYTNESIFRQEGWHYELGEDGKPFYNGVVFNEMKGALGSVDGLMERVVKQYLYPDSIYGFESGGDPKAIPNLTYENFLKAHREFYAPSNAKLYLDGDVPLERVLRLIDEEYLSDFDDIEQPHAIAMQQPIERTDITSYYEIGREESEAQKTQLVFAKVFADWQDRKRIMAYTLIASYLAGSNESPLKRAMLEKGLAQDVEFSVLDGIAQPYYCIVFRNTDSDKKDAITATYTEVLQNILTNGIDREELTGALNQFEFSLRETEEPQGLIRNINLLSSWLYGGDALLYLENDALFAQLRSDMQGDYFDSIIRELADFAGTLTLTMLPSKTKGEEDRTAEEQRVQAEYSAFSDEEKAHVAAVYEKMRAWQDTPDSPEAAATLPVLSLSDVSKTPMWTDTAVKEANGVRLLYHQVNTNGIIHANLFFDISDEKAENLPAISLLTNLFTLLPTKQHTPQELQKKIKKTIGVIDFNTDTVSVKDKPLEAKVYFTVSFSVLEQNIDRALALVLEILTQTDYNNREIIRENILQAAESLYQSMMGAGHMYAMKRVLMPTSATAYADEQCTGYSLLSYLNAFKDNFDSRIEDYIAYLTDRTKEVFTLSRLTVGETAAQYSAAFDVLSGCLPQGTAPAQPMQVQKQPKKQEAILIPSGVSYAAYGSNIQDYGFCYEGKLTVTSLLLTYGYLWNEIRVHGGAYGCGFRAGLNGNNTFHSYRDPNPLGSLNVYRNTASFIRDYVKSDEGVEKYIISSIAATEGLQSTAKQGYLADISFLAGRTYEDKLATRTQMLTLKKEDLLSVCELFDKMKDGSSVCIVGNEEALSSLGEDWQIYRL